MEISSRDMLLEIFSRLPAKAIHKFKCIDKWFLESSHDTYFALKQANNALTKDDCCFFIQPSIVQRLSCNIELHPLLGEETCAGVPNDTLEFLANYSAKTLASSNGLILCRTTTMNNQVGLIVINPATRSYLPILTPEEVQKCIDANLELVFECDLKGFKVFLFYNPEWSSYLNCQVFSSEEGEWRIVDSSFFTGPRNLRFDMPVCYSGAMHFISDCSPSFAKNNPYFRPYIASFDYENDISRMLRLPEEAKRVSEDDSCCEIGIFRWGKVGSKAQSLCLVVLGNYMFTIWVLMDYESSSWRMIMEARVEAMVGTREHNPTVTGYSVLNGECLIFATEKKVYRYNLTHVKDMEIEEIGEHECKSSNVYIMPYSNTLRPCGTSQFPSCFADVATSPDEEGSTSSSEVLHYYKDFLQIPLPSPEEQPRDSFLFYAFTFACIAILLYQFYFSLF